MKTKNATLVLPYFVAIFCVVTLYQANAERLSPDSMFLPLAYGLVIAGFFHLLAWLNKWTSKSAPLVAGSFTFCFLLWHLLPWVGDLLILATVVIIAWIYKERTKAASTIMTLMFIVAILFSLINGVVINSRKAEGSQQPYTYIDGQPNIYFIVPDRMPSPVAMMEAGIDPGETVSRLQGLGFYVPQDNRSADLFTIDYPYKVHTTRTMRFFASVLNDGVQVDTEITYQDCRAMIRDNALFLELHDKGYQVFNYASWFTETSSFINADRNEKYGDVNIIERLLQNELGEVFIDRSLLRGFPLRKVLADDDMEIRRHDWQAQQIIDTAAAGYESTFVISHIMLPHEPFVYAESGLSTPEQYYANIRYALTYLESLAGQIRELDPTAAVIIQSDEGMAFQKPPEINEDLSPAQWSGVFTAWYLPESIVDTADLNLNSIAHTDILDIVVGGK